MSQKADLVKQSSTIKGLLKDRVELLGLSYTQIKNEADRFGQSNVTVATLSRYFHDIAKNSLSQESIIFLCCRWGIDIALLVGTPRIVDGKIKTFIPPYDEGKCLAKTKKLFGDGKK